MASWTKPENTESLQCIACAAHQVLGDGLGHQDLLQLMRKSHQQQSTIAQSFGIDDRIHDTLERWSNVSSKSDQKLLVEWLDSSIWISKSLRQSQYFDGSNYVFYREDQFPGTSPIKSFKNVFSILKNRIKDAANKGGEFAKSTAGKIYNSVRIDSNKWNPADIIAVKSGKENEWKSYLNSWHRGNPEFPPGFKQGGLQDDLASYAEELSMKQWVKSGGNKLRKLDIIPQLKDLYDFNRLCYRGIEDQEFIPISLKMAKSDNPQVAISKRTEPSDIEKYFKMKVRITSVQMKADDQKAIVKFRVSGLRGKNGAMSFDIRGFEETAKLADIQMGLLKPGAAAYAGKATLPIATLITKESGGTAAITSMKTKKRDIFKDKRWGLRNRLQRKMTSRIHGLTDYRVFDEYTKMQPILYNYDAILWGEYAEWLSGKKTTQKQFVEEATGQAMVTAATSSRAVTVKGLKPSHVQAKYMKNKIQSYEMAYILKRAKIDKRIRLNILKSLFLYAASEGLTIFNLTSVNSYMIAGPYIKCAA